MPQHPGDERHHAAGLDGDLPARLALVEVGVAEAHDERRVEEQAHRDRGARFRIFARAAEDQVEQHEDQEQPVDLGHGARDAAQLFLLDRDRGPRRGR